MDEYYELLRMMSIALVAFAAGACLTHACDLATSTPDVFTTQPQTVRQANPVKIP